jgi:hypothetical protein
MSKGVILFSSIHYVLHAEKLIKAKGFFFDLIPVPRHLSSDCGICLLFDWEQKEQLIDLLEKAGLKIEGVHLLDNREK